MKETSAMTLRYSGSAEASRWPSVTKPTRSPSSSTTGTPGVLLSSRIPRVSLSVVLGVTVSTGCMISSSLMSRPLCWSNASSLLTRASDLLIADLGVYLTPNYIAARYGRDLRRSALCPGAGVHRRRARAPDGCRASRGSSDRSLRYRRAVRGGERVRRLEHHRASSRDDDHSFCARQDRPLQIPGDKERPVGQGPPDPHP